MRLCFFSLFSILINICILTSCTNKSDRVISQTNLGQYDYICYADSSKGIKFGEAELFRGPYDYVEYINENVPFFSCKCKNGYYQIMSSEGNVLVDTTERIIKYGHVLKDNEYVSHNDLVIYKVLTIDNLQGAYDLNWNKIADPIYKYVSAEELESWDFEKKINTTKGFYVRASNEEGKITIIDSLGKIIVPLDNYKNVNSHNRFYEINKDSEAKRLSLSNYGDIMLHLGYCVETKDGKKGLFNNKGDKVIEPTYDDFTPVFLSSIYKEGDILFWQTKAYNETKGLLNAEGKTIVPSGKYTSIYIYDEDNCKFIEAGYETGERRSTVSAAYDYDGNIIIPDIKVWMIRHKDGKFQVLPNAPSNANLDDWYKYEWIDYAPYIVDKYKVANNTTQTISGGSNNSAPSYNTSGGVKQVWVPCYECNGSGECRYCHGKGWDYVTNSRGEVISSSDCPICHRSGRCQSCAGNRGHYETQIQ